MKLEKSYNTKQYFHSFYRQNHALLVLSFLFTVICFPANLIGSWLLGQVIDAITEVSMNRLRTIILVSIIFIVTMFFFTILLYWVKSNFIRKALIQYKNLAFEKISEKNIAAFSRSLSQTPWNLGMKNQHRKSPIASSHIKYRRISTICQPRQIEF